MKKRYANGGMAACLLCLALLVSACGNAGNNTNNQNGAAQSSSSAKPTGEQGSPSPKFPRTIQDAGGEVTIEEEPTRIAVAHWGYSDSILLFDLKSVALTLPFTKEQSVLETDQYKPYVDKVNELEIVGENTEVNLEALLSYNPQLIIAGNDTNSAIIDQLKSIATTVVIDESETDVWGDWPSLVTKLGEILGQEEQAASYIAEYKEQVADAKEKLADLQGNVAFVQVRDNVVYLQGKKYLTQYYDQLGLNAPESVIIENGAEISLEGLSKLNPDHLFLGYFNYEDPSLPALTDEWEKSAVWKSLSSVQNDQVYGINGQLALGYGPIGNTYGLKAITNALQ